MKSMVSIWLDVRHPSKKWQTGRPPSIAARCATRARSIVSCTEADDRYAKPDARVAITSLWSPKMLKAWVASERAPTWKTAGTRFPAILYMFEIISISPWELVKVVASDPVANAPWVAPAAPSSLSISATRIGTPM